MFVFADAAQPQMQVDNARRMSGYDVEGVVEMWHKATCLVGRRQLHVAGENWLFICVDDIPEKK